MKEGWLADIENNEIQNSQVSVYPNPFTNTTNIRFKLTGGTNVELNVYNLVGQKVMSRDLGYRINGEHNVSFDKGGLTAGLYILQITTDYDKAGIVTKVSIK